MTEIKTTLKDHASKREIETKILIENDKLYRVLGKISIDGAGTRYLAPKVCQPMENFNLELYQKALRLKKMKMRMIKLRFGLKQNRLITTLS